MVDIPVRRRQGVPSWIWVVIGVIVLVAVLALVDYFVTNMVLNRPPAAPPDRSPSPVGPAGTTLILLGGLIGPFTRRSH